MRCHPENGSKREIRENESWATSGHRLGIADSIQDSSDAVGYASHDCVPRVLEACNEDAEAYDQHLLEEVLVDPLRDV